MIFKEISVAKNCLRPESALLTEPKLQGYFRGDLIKFSKKV